MSKFDGTIELATQVNYKSLQNVRGTISLPHGTGKKIRVLVFCKGEKQNEAKAAGADFVGDMDLIEKVAGGWTDFDVVIASPNVMAKIAKIGKILGPRNLMPNPKSGTVSPEVGKAVEEVKKGKIAFKVDKYGIVHTSVGRVSFTPEQISDNASALLGVISKMKPASSKGVYFKGISMASTMSPGINVDYKTVAGL